MRGEVFGTKAQVFVKKSHQMCRFSHQTRKFLSRRVQKFAEINGNLQKCAKINKNAQKQVLFEHVFFTPPRKLFDMNILD